MPFWQQWLFNYGAGYAFDRLLSPPIRQGTERLLGRRSSKAYRPDLTPGYLARDVFTSVAGYAVGQRALRIAQSVTGQARAGSSLVSSGGLVGQQAVSAAAGLTAGTLGSMVVSSMATSMAFTFLDMLLANRVGGPIEDGVNRLLGYRGKRGARSGKDGSTVPTHMVRMDSEQAARNFGRNSVNAAAYALTSATLGAEIARAAVGALPGAGGALVGAVGSAVAASVVAGVLDAWVGARVANASQTGLRAVKRLLGKPVAPRKVGDVVQVPGDRFSRSVRGVMVPWVTAAVSGQSASFVQSITPPPLTVVRAAAAT